MSYLLDTNVLSEIWKPSPDERVENWVRGAEWFLPVPVIAEIQEGAEAAPSPVKRLEITARLSELLRVCPGVVVPWDENTALIWAKLRHSHEVKRQPQAFWDSLIDALAVQHGFCVATRNGGDFRHAETFNPWSEDPAAETPA